ncbi:MAG: hypothetical protein A3H52_00210 [Candidatus Zambryskibacteria bacterium RIFCSPLOWO2_02_FULL_39_26]|nr:MAG: hypothetical protein A3H52_00210 [Candidatus Zambryskibacteria bacterium RIFCSPLOWO2_02_FULL_39_26]
MQISIRGLIFGMFFVLALTSVGGLEVPDDSVIPTNSWMAVGAVSIIAIFVMSLEADRMFLAWFPGWWHRMTRPINTNRTKIVRPR